jgi:regulator of replication initiation timing
MITNDDVLLMIQKRDQLLSEKKILDLREAALRKRIEAVQKDLAAACAHENVDEESSYYGGSYDEVARTFYSHKCIICGTVLKTWDKSHGYYG